MSDDYETRLAELRAERDALLTHDIHVWLENIVEQAQIADYANSLSWRITKPLRLVRAYQLHLRREGVRSANAQVWSVVRSRLGR